MGEAGTKPAGLRLGGHSAAPAAPTLPASENQSKSQTVRIWLYGALSQLCHERPLTIEFPRGITVSEDQRRAVVVCVLDNLLKGAATQAMQNLNLALGFDELKGIEL